MTSALRPASRPPVRRSFHGRTIAAAAAAVAAAALAVVPASPPRAHAAVSKNCALLAQRDSLPGTGSSCWGYVDPTTGNEYAIFGNQFGTAVYNIVNPTAPYLTGFIPGPNSGWREMKTFGRYCYVSNETGGGLQIIDLIDPEAPVLAATYTGSGINTTHSVTIDTTKARLYANGANGGMRILSLANPLAPVQIGVYTASYVHDCYATNDTVYAACIGAGQVRILGSTSS
jgi:choice-of-anchor B domain-containing protein